MKLCKLLIGSLIGISLFGCKTVYASEVADIEVIPIILPEISEDNSESKDSSESEEHRSKSAEEFKPTIISGIEIIPADIYKSENESVVQDYEDGIYRPDYGYCSDQSGDSREITLIGADRIDKVNGQREFPASTVVKVEAILKGEFEGYGVAATGVFIGENAILTSAHTFINEDTKEMYPLKKIIIKTNCGDATYSDIGNADRIYISTEYLQIMQDWKENPDKWKKDDEELINLEVSSDFAIIHINENLGKKYGWLGMEVLNTSNGTQHGTLYQYPSVVPNLPDFNKLVETLRADAKNNKISGRNKGVCIDTKDAINYMKNGNIDGGEYVPEYYKDLFKDNSKNCDLYSSYGIIEYKSFCPNILEYDLSCYNQASGGPVISYKYNYATRKFDAFICGINSTYYSKYTPDESKPMNDLCAYVVDEVFNNAVNFNYDFPDSNLTRCHTGMTQYGKNYAMAISNRLIEYIKQEGFSTCVEYNPKNDKSKAQNGEIKTIVNMM